MKKVEIGSKARVNIKWEVSTTDYSHEEEDRIVSEFANKYGIEKKQVSVEPIFNKKNGLYDIGDGQDNLIGNIQDIAFQQKLFSEYIKEKEIANIDFDKIIEIDNLINTNINYDVYESNKKYSIKWLKWSNFMSYGKDNFFDFTKLSGLVLLTSEPANQGGKTTFSIDLFRFLLYGKVTSRENDWTLSKVFNKHLNNETEVTVEGCINIDGEDYVIRRTITRPSAKKRTEKSKVIQKVNYFHVIDNEYVDLNECDNEESSSTKETNKVIKDAIGNEMDFDLMICVDSDNLKSLISLKDTDRGRLISRWIGLLPLEEKDKIARNAFNELSKTLLTNRYNSEDLENENKSLNETIKDSKKEIKKAQKDIKSSEEKIKNYEEEKDEKAKLRVKIDEELTKVDVNTVKAKMNTATENGKVKRAEKECNEKLLKGLEDLEFNERKYKELTENRIELEKELVTLRYQVKTIKYEIETLEKSEYCPTCGAKLKNVDNTERIKDKKEEYSKNVDKGKAKGEELKNVVNKIESMEEQRIKYNEKIRLQLLLAKNSVDLQNIINEYRECERIVKDIENNIEAIKINNEIDTKVNVINESIKVEKQIMSNKTDSKNEFERVVKTYEEQLSKNSVILNTLQDEGKLIKHWRVYLDMIGKNGISKMLIRTVLPLINGELKRLLLDVCDFDVEVTIDEHNDVAFYLIHDGVKSNLGSGSGFEKTVSSLALRSVLCKISTFSKPSFVVFDEILGGVSDENYDQVKLLYDKVVKDYSCILQITHLKQIADWHNKTILVKKENNISTIIAE